MKNFLLLSSLLGASVALSPVSAANFLVDDDGDDAGTPGTLRHSIAQANGNAEEDTITIDASVFFIALLDDGPLVISSTDKITIDASGVTNGVAISGFEGNGLGLPSRVIEVNAGASLELVGVEITDGKAADGDDGVDGAVPTNGGDGGNGGGIFNEGTLVLRDCKIVFNEAGDGGNAGNKTGAGAGSAGLAGNGGRGGGIYSQGDGSSVAMYNCEVSDNTAGNGGAGGSVATGDTGTASDGGAGGNGGGIAAYDLTAIRITETKFELNKSGQGGGGGLDGNSGTGGNGGNGGDGGAIAMELPKQMGNPEAAGEFFPLIQDSVFSNNNNKVLNNATGGIGGDNDLVATDTIGDGGRGGHGGAIWVEKFASAATGSSHLTRSLFRQNATGVGEKGEFGGHGGDGGAIYIKSPAVTDDEWKMDNCTFTQNETRSGGLTVGGGSAGRAGNGGAIAFEAGVANDYTAALTHLTITGNNAGGNGGSGGGIWEGDNGGGGIGFGGRGVTLANSIVCLNQADTDPNIEIGFLFDGNNLVGVDPDLDVLTDLGGAAEVLPPNLSSPAIDGGGALANPLSVDQRGFPRPSGGAPDIGAMEVGLQPDAKIGTKSNPNSHRINNVYRVSAAGQTKTLKLKNRRKGKMYFSVENDGDITDSLTVRGTKPNRKVRMKVFRLTGGRVNVSAPIRLGYALGDVDAGSTVVFLAEAKARSRKKKARQNFTYRATSGVGDTLDSVKIKVRQKK